PKALAFRLPRLFFGEPLACAHAATFTIIEWRANLHAQADLMRSGSWLKLPPLKLHTRTTIVTSAVLVAVFAIMAYFSDLAITRLSDQQERQQAQLLATRVADTVELHIKRLKRREERH